MATHPSSTTRAEVRIDPRVRAIVAELRRRLEALYGERLERVVLYGSQARGDADASDIDVLGVLRGEVDPVREIDRSGESTWMLSLENDVAISKVFVSSYSFHSKERPFLINVRREGITLSPRSRPDSSRKQGEAFRRRL